MNPRVRKSFSGSLFLVENSFFAGKVLLDDRERDLSVVWRRSANV